MMNYSVCLTFPNVPELQSRCALQVKTPFAVFLVEHNSSGCGSDRLCCVSVPRVSFLFWLDVIIPLYAALTLSSQGRHQLSDSAFEPYGPSSSLSLKPQWHRCLC